MLNPTPPQIAMLATDRKIKRSVKKSGSGRPSAAAASRIGLRSAGT